MELLEEFQTHQSRERIIFLNMLWGHQIPTPHLLHTEKHMAQLLFRPHMPQECRNIWGLSNKVLEFLD